MLIKKYFLICFIFSIVFFLSAYSTVYSQLKLKESAGISHLKIDTASKKLSSFKLINSKLTRSDLVNTSKVNYIKFGSLVGFTVGAVLFLHNFQQHAWWSGQRGKFHIQNDWAYALSMDKIGHFMEGGLISKTMKNGFIWSGMSEKSSIWLGALFSIAYMTDIEIEDGFATQWGYSPGDEIANLTGDIFSVAQDLWTPLQTVKIKWSYIPTGDPKHKGDFPDDYGGQVFWLSFDVNSYLGKKWEKPWPDWLNLAIGYGVLDYENYGPGGRRQQFYLALDYDLRKIIPGNSGFMKGLKEFLNTFKIIPTPAIRWDITTHKLEFVIR